MRIRRLGNQVGAAQQAAWAEQLLRVGEGRETTFPAFEPDHIKVPSDLLMALQRVANQATSCVIELFKVYSCSVDLGPTCHVLFSWLSMCCAYSGVQMASKSCFTPSTATSALQMRTAFCAGTIGAKER